MKVEIVNEGMQFYFWKYINQIFFAVHIKILCLNYKSDHISMYFKFYGTSQFQQQYRSYMFCLHLKTVKGLNTYIL